MRLLRDYLVVILTIGAAAYIALLPTVFDGYPRSHSLPFNIPWTVGFLGELFDGNLYPRWLHSYPAGLGAPVFYFYAPLPFYLSATGYLMCQSCGIIDIFQYSHWLGFFLSGIAFYAWARNIGGYYPALFCAVLYIFLPYHLLGVFLRGTLGETMTYVFMPLILIHVNKLTTSNRSLLWAAVFYAGLILSHLPSALLFTFIWIIYAFIGTPKSNMLKMVVRSFYAGLLGAGLSAFYVFPALALRKYLPTGGWLNASGPHHYPENNLFFREGNLTGFVEFLFSIMVSMSAAALFFVVAIGLMQRRNPDAFSITRAQTTNMIAAVTALGFCWFMMSAPSKVIWVNIDAMRQVQFPWRLFPAVEFSSLALLLILIELGTVGLRQSGKKVAKPLLASIGVAGVVVATLCFKVVWDRAIFSPYMQGLPQMMAQSIKQQSTQQLGGDFGTSLPVEYRTRWIVGSEKYISRLPEGSSFKDKNNAYLSYYYGFQNWSEYINDLPIAGLGNTFDQSGLVSLDNNGAGQYNIRVETVVRSQVYIRKTYFPHWVLTDTMAGKTIDIVPRKIDGLIGFEIAAGKHNLVLSTKWFLSEIIGAIISMIAVLIGLVLGIRPQKLPKRVA